jgi:aminopeptidase N
VARSPRGVTFGPDGAYTIFFSCHWMVCREEPGDKATLSLAITVPRGATVVASGGPEAPRPTRDGLVRHVWREPRPHSSYLFAFAVGPFSRTVERHGRTALEYYAANVDPSMLARLFAETGEMLDFFAEKAGLPFPQPAYRQVLVEGDEAQEAAAFSILGRKTLEHRLETPDEDWAVAHELAHQYWGNLVTCADWSHFWLNEGLTVFMVGAWKEHRWGRAAYQRELDLARQRRQRAIDAGFDVPLAFAGEYPSLKLKRAIVYSKGALFLAALREAMGDASFWSALRKYTRTFAGRSVTSADFQRVFAASTPRDLRPLFEGWVYPRSE